jgi:glycosyltransferase involved in cell wall biosynthesis
LSSEGIAKDKLDVIINASYKERGAVAENTRWQTRIRWGIRPEEFVFGFVGRLSEEKGVQYLLEAVGIWHQESHWRVVLVGDGPCRGALERRVRELGLENRVVFAGFQVDIADWYAAMDAFVLPSLTEGTPMVLLEAMGNNVPVIATAVGGVPAVISNGRTGLLVPPRAALDLFHAMRSLASDAALRERIRTMAKTMLRDKYSIDNWIKKIIASYKRALEIPVEGNREGRA